LLNFDAYSYPDIGGWIVIGVGICFFLIWFYEWYRTKKRTAASAIVLQNGVKIVTAFSAIFFFASCSTGPASINYGKDNCTDCSMTIMDAKFASEIITKKGKVFKFDDAHCILSYIKSGKIKKEEIASTVFLDFNNAQNFLPAESAFFVVSNSLKSPMNGNTIAVASREVANNTAKETRGVVKTWSELSSQ